MRKKTIWKKIISLYWVKWSEHVVSLDTNYLKRKTLVRVEKSQKKVYSWLSNYWLVNYSSNGFTLLIFNLSSFFPRWIVIVPFVWTVVIVHGSFCHMDCALWSIPLFCTSNFWPILWSYSILPLFSRAVLRSVSSCLCSPIFFQSAWTECQIEYLVQILLHLVWLLILYGG